MNRRAVLAVALALVSTPALAAVPNDQDQYDWSHTEIECSQVKRLNPAAYVVTGTVWVHGMRARGVTVTPGKMTIGDDDLYDTIRSKCP